MDPTNSAKPVVHVIDDDTSIRAAITRLLHYCGFDTRSYASAAEFLLKAREDRPGCILLDVALPGMDGMELHTALAKSNDQIPVVFLTARGDIDMSVQAMKTGAVDFLTKPVKREKLLGAIGVALARDTEARARREQLRELRARYERLTNRELDVFARVVKGKLNKQIADELSTSIRTVKAHRAKVMEKMEVASLAELVRIADELGAFAHD